MKLTGPVRLGRRDPKLVPDYVAPCAPIKAPKRKRRKGPKGERISAHKVTPTRVTDFRALSEYRVQVRDAIRQLHWEVSARDPALALQLQAVNTQDEAHTALAKVLEAFSHTARGWGSVGQRAINRRLCRRVRDLVTRIPEMALPEIQIPTYTRCGNIACMTCGKQYIEHPATPFGDYLTLHLLCSGHWVKL